MKSSAYEPGLTKVKVKIPILGRLADLSLVKNKHEANGALILPSCLHQWSFYGVDVNLRIEVATFQSFPHKRLAITDRANP